MTRFLSVPLLRPDEHLELEVEFNDEGDGPYPLRVQARRNGIWRDEELSASEWEQVREWIEENDS